MIHPYDHENSFLYFFSASTSQEFLKKCYLKQNLEQAEQKSYENSYPFIYYLEHGQVYYQQAEKAPLVIKPILYFYGLVHLVKACILTVDPNYPETTSVLAHGVSTRKRKKQHYNFFQDEVKFQKSGLFPYMGEKLFHMKHLEGEKTTMGELLSQIPELNDLYNQTEGRTTYLEIEQDKDLFIFPKKILDTFHMTETRFVEYLQSKSDFNIKFKESDESVMNFMLKNINTYYFKPLRYSPDCRKFFFPPAKDELSDFPELLIHFLLLYNLSMIARYETEWWSELIKMMPNKDYPFIQTFLKITATKGPYLIYQYLVDMKI
ncbi:YaaC family protein [Cytobacillus sp. NCCP-133]|uniref:YaaC family protein n=1 Tax=Cytobacillus sp. NCCP-133 TaxID=766848 RepID=UPI00222FF9A7|nr:YaaC family protein [Cytobacillus sp. NCCP-133]GLB62050.1 hypothetical protein NCCP133_41790 [Cytobacillus sp. NCCP-133]